MNRKELAILAVITLFTVTVWIVFDIFHTKSQTKIMQEGLKQVEPLTPTFDNDIINKLKNREE